jgi:hypothetical protein
VEDVAARLRERWSALQEAMELGDVTALAELLADECTVTHLTGVERTKREWLADLDADCTRYHGRSRPPRPRGHRPDRDGVDDRRLPLLVAPAAPDLLPLPVRCLARDLDGRRHLVTHHRSMAPPPARVPLRPVGRRSHGRASEGIA